LLKKFQFTNYFEENIILANEESIKV